MTHRHAAFAIPGEITTVTGGYIYERRLLEGLRERGHDVQHIQLAASFPDPTPKDMDAAIAALKNLDTSRALILDGLVYGSIDTEGLSQVRAPIVAMIHHPLALETGLGAARKRHLFKTERDNLALAAHVLVPSPHTADILCRDYAVPREHITIARPGTERFPGKRTPTDPPLILSVGILHPRKGHDILLRALAQITDLRWRAAIVGAPWDQEHAATLAMLRDDLGLTDRVALTGRIPRADLDALYAQATLFALATRFEGYGIVFDEALAASLPIVTCATGAVPQTVPAEAGILVPPDDPDVLAQATRKVLTDAALRTRLTSAAGAAGRELPSWQDTADIAGKVLDKLSCR